MIQDAKVPGNRIGSQKTEVLDDSEKGGAKSDADFGKSPSVDDDLQFVVDCWPDLLPYYREKVLSIVREFKKSFSASSEYPERRDVT